MRLTNRIVDLAIEYEVVDQEEKETYLVATELLLFSALTWGTLLLMGALCGQLTGCLIFLAFHLPVRIFAGGFHQKTRIGRLSAYCGAVSAACGSGAAITWLKGGDEKRIESTIINTLANVSGIICDGAKPSCAAKIASAVDAAIIADSLSWENERFADGEGIVKEDAESTIAGVGVIAREGMQDTDDEILSVMIEK